MEYGEFWTASLMLLRVAVVTALLIMLLRHGDLVTARNRAQRDRDFLANAIERAITIIEEDDELIVRAGPVVNALRWALERKSE